MMAGVEVEAEAPIRHRAVQPAERRRPTDAAGHHREREPRHRASLSLGYAVIIPKSDPKSDPPHTP